MAEIRKALTAVSLKPEEYASYSFRISAATTAVQMGLQDSLIKTLGRWQSSAYTLYIKTPREVLCGVAKELIRDNETTGSKTSRELRPSAVHSDLRETPV